MHFVNKTIFEIPNATVLVNTVNCVGVMGKGLALEIKERYPLNFKKYKMYCDNSQLTIGTICYLTENNMTILNFPTKVHWKDKSQYEYIETGLKVLKQILLNYVKSKPHHVIAIPMLGCNNGGLSWKKVKELIKQELADIQLEIYICEKQIN